MLLKDLFVREDRRRSRSRPTLLAWIALSVLGVLGAGATILGGRTLSTSGPVESMKPIATSSPESTPLPAAATATVTPIGGCPDDPSQWRIVAYQLPASDRDLYQLDPSCVMEEVEAAYAAYLDARAIGGRYWMERAQYISDRPFTAPLSGEKRELDSQNGRAGASYCIEERGPHGAPKTSDDYHIVFYTISQEGTAALMVVSRGEPSTTHVYECGTDNLVQEIPDDGMIGVVYWPMIYEEGRWLRGRRPDVTARMPADGVDPAAMEDAVLRAQGRR